MTGSKETAAKVLKWCGRRRWSLSVAESCTGGLVGGCLTAVPGSSAVFIGGVIAYSNAAKERLLGVPPEILHLRGAVSEETAIAMARGVVKITGSECGVSVTGVAGPGGGTREKPVGTVWFGAVSPRKELSRLGRFDGSRDHVREQSVQAALELVLELVGPEKR